MSYEITPAQKSNCSISGPANMSETLPVIYGKKKWRRHVADVVKRLVAAIEPDEVVLGGGNVKKLKELPAGCRVGDNANAFLGGIRVWEEAGVRKHSLRAKPGFHNRKRTQVSRRKETKR